MPLYFDYASCPLFALVYISLHQFASVCMLIGTEPPISVAHIAQVGVGVDSLTVNSCGIHLNGKMEGTSGCPGLCNAMSPKMFPICPRL